MGGRIRIGDMLVAAGLVSEADVTEALARQKASGRRLGDELCEMGLISEIQLTQMVSNQLSLPWVSLYHVEFTRELLDLVPAVIAERYRAIPIYVRALRKQGDTLYVAMDDPTNEVALAALAAASGLPVRVMVAPPSEIRNAIRVYYFGESPMPAPSIAPARVEPTSSPEASELAERPSTELIDAPEPAPASREEPSVEPSAERPTAKRAKAGFVTLTLLDGTRVRLPASGAKGAADASQPRGLTAHDLIAALQAKGEGKDVSQVLPEDSIEILFASLLSLLIRKGLVADWEFVAEYQKHAKKRSGAS